METNKNDFATYTNPHAGILLAEELNARGITYEKFAETSGLPLDVVKDVAKGCHDITLDIAQKLESSLNIPAKTWLGLQHRYDTWPERRAAYEAAHPEVPRSKELIKIQKSRKKATIQIDENKDWLSVMDKIKNFVIGKGLGEMQHLKITLDAQPA